MTDPRAHARPGRAWAPRTLDAGRTTAEQPLPWLVAAAVFLANALLTLSQGYWWLAALEGATSLLALLSAAAASTRSHGSGRSRLDASGEPDSRLDIR